MNPTAHPLINILVVAFDRFGHYRCNSAKDASNHWAMSKNHGTWIQAMSYPAAIPIEDRGTQVFYEAKRIGVTRIIVVGMDSSSDRLKIETRARNRVYHEKYCNRGQNNSRVDSGYGLDEVIPLTRQLARWDTKAFIAAAKKADIPAGLSEDAGTFCCNHLMAQMAIAEKKGVPGSDRPWIFVHVPCTPEAVASGNEDFFKAGKTTMPLGKIVHGLDLLLEHADPKKAD